MSDPASHTDQLAASQAAIRELLAEIDRLTEDNAHLRHLVGIIVDGQGDEQPDEFVPFDEYGVDPRTAEVER